MSDILAWSIIAVFAVVFIEVMLYVLVSTVAVSESKSRTFVLTALAWTNALLLAGAAFGWAVHHVR